MIELGIAMPRDADALARLYRDAGYGAAVGAEDTVLVAKTAASLVGAVRLCREEGVLVLRGMQVRRDVQRQGIGSRLLATCLPYLARAEAFCLPYAHLEGFYATAGFAPADSAALPAFLADRLATYRSRGQDVIAMRRPAG
ncbi:GNAT family N-acetyltransferase [uncultured Massilia sp.]|uniref:GNAT family N-acetyltransferase n=1 Tax=uncultured Massilia sp. TaxID=169973 RepID=UPI00258D8327|nr:GNAT family N-acetyltransferase [uncultured Massilia sp.]